MPLLDLHLQILDLLILGVEGILLAPVLLLQQVKILGARRPFQAQYRQLVSHPFNLTLDDLPLVSFDLQHSLKLINLLFELIFKLLKRKRLALH
jgi:hypothetical protein